MSAIRGKLVWLLVAAATVWPAAAQANNIGWGEVARGLSLLDFRFSAEKNLLGDGWTINENAVWNNRRFDFGVADLTLTGVLNTSAGYTMRGIPSANFSMTSGGGPLTYDFNTNNGIQELNATGSALIDINTHINAFGFYDQSITISNRGTFSQSGYALVDSGTLDYDVGPINIHGNIFADVLGAVTEPFFVANNLDNPFIKLSGRAARAAEAEKTAEALRARVEAGEVLNDDDIAKLVNETLIAAMLGGTPEALDDFMLPANFFDAASLTPSLSASLHEAPEPTAALLLALGFLAVPRRRWRA